jgi:rRNA maturation endonuclease Nob1
MLTLEELKDRLAHRFDEVTLMERLDISSEELVQAFSDKIEELYDELVEEVTEDEEEDDDGITD